MRKRVKITKGSTLIEVLVAATLITTAILASLALSTSSQKQTDFSRDLNQATVYNDQALDWIRNMRSTMGLQSLIEEVRLDIGGPTGSATYCLSTLPETSDEYAAMTSISCDMTDPSDKVNGTMYMREMAITVPSNPTDSASIVITTYWADKEHSTVTETTLADWQ